VISTACKFLIVDTYYPFFSDTFYKNRPDLAEASYDDTLAALTAECFGTADFYSKNLKLLGNDAVDVVANDLVLQEKWATASGIGLPGWLRREIPMRALSRARRVAKMPSRMSRILAERIKAERPDVLYFQNVGLCEPWLIREIRPFVKLIVGQIASLPPGERYLRGCDLILTSFPRFVDRFRSMGINSEYLKIAFEPTVLERLPKHESPFEVVFVGGFGKVHAKGTAILEKVAKEIELDVWGYGAENIRADSPLRRHFHGEAWGIQMYAVLFNSKIVINRHGLVAPENEDYANNMRLYEATGSGAMLITDEKDNLGELFEVGSEVVSYSDADDLVEKIRYYLTHEDERRAIARSGQSRTLREHTYRQRMEELEQIIEAYL